MKFISRLFSFLLMGALFIVTAHLTIDLVTKLLPDKYWYLPSMSVGAFDGGFIVWGLTLLYVVENGAQRSVAWLMIAIDFSGIAICAVADVFLADAAKGLVATIPPDQMRWIVFGVVAIIIVNVAAWSSMHVLSPEHIERATGKQSRSLHAPRTTAVTPMRRLAPAKVRIAQTVEPPRNIKQLPPPIPIEEIEEPEEIEDYSEAEEETQEVEAVEAIPFWERLVAAKNALIPPKPGAKKPLPTRN